MMEQMNAGSRRGPSRRELLKQIGFLGALAPFFRRSALFPLARVSDGQFSSPSSFASAYRTPSDEEFLRQLAGSDQSLSPDEDAFLQTLEEANFRFFWEQANPDTGLVRDRANVRKPDQNELGNIAATGFGLTALCIGDKRGFVSHKEAADRVRNTLQFIWTKLPHHRGFFFHWTSINSGERLWGSEISSIDTAILLCGVLTCRMHFQDDEIRQLTRLIFDRVEWDWLSEDTELLPHGWTPESGFLHYRWANYSEMMMMYLLGLGSKSHPLPAGSWYAWKRTLFQYGGLRYIGFFAPLFIHQYSQAWFDFRHKHDRDADYFENSILATEAHRRFCLDLAAEFPDYSEDLWGITASDSVNGYVVWGGPPATGPIDGSIVPCAAAGSLPFLPKACLRVLRAIKDRYGTKAWCQYGFVDAFNPLTDWYDTDVVGINVGIGMLMAENVRTGFVWETFMKNPEAQLGFKRAGFVAKAPAPTHP
jgi:hypothetical protein